MTGVGKIRKYFVGAGWLGFVLFMLLGLLSAPCTAQVQVIASDLTTPHSIVVDGTYVYWTEGDNYVKWTNKDGSSKTPYSYWDSPGFPGWTDITSSGFGILFQDEAFLYFAQRAPAANPPSAAPAEGVAPLTVKLTAGAPIGNVTSWFWDFSDGSTDTARDPSHTYALPNTYFPVLTVTGPGGSSEPEGCGPIVVDNPGSGFSPLAAIGPGGSYDGDSGERLSSPDSPPLILPAPQIVRLPKFASPETLPSPLFNYSSGPGNGSTGGPFVVYLGKVFFGYWLTDYAYSFDIREVSTEGATDSSQVQDLCSNNEQVTCMAADHVNVYWGERHMDGTGAIRSVPQVGGIVSTIETLPGIPYSLVTPTAGAGAGKIFWIEQGPLFSVLNVYEPGGPVSVMDSMVMPLGMGNVNALAVDAVNVYYFGLGAAGVELRQLPIGGGKYEVLASGLIYPQGLAVDSGYVYWTDWGDLWGTAGQGTVNRAAKDIPFQVSFTANPMSGMAPLTVEFTNLSTGPIISSTWSFGDGAYSGEDEPIHTYNKPGKYKATLTVNSSIKKTVTIQVTKPPKPKASFTVNPTTGAAPLSVQFTDTSTGPITSWAWIFGDGGTSTEQNPSHTYNKPGKYKPKLTVTGPGGSMSKTATVKVTP